MRATFFGAFGGSLAAFCVLLSAPLFAEELSRKQKLPLLASLPTELVEKQLEQVVSETYLNGLQEQEAPSLNTFKLPNFANVSLDDFVIVEPGVAAQKVKPEPVVWTQTKKTKNYVVTTPQKLPKQSWSDWSEAELLSSETLAKLAIQNRNNRLTSEAETGVVLEKPSPALQQQSAANKFVDPVPQTKIPVRTNPTPLALPDQSRAPSIGAPILVRIFKEEAELELWMKQGNRFSLFKTYPICRFSGRLGPKLKTGDHQAPEGFYFVNRGQMNPYSKNHRAFNLGFPNLYDRSFGRTGSFLMVHGGCSSVGCYAITDEHISEVYALADAALAEGQAAFQVHAFPFRMTPQNMKRHRKSKWYGFWQNLKVGYDAFEVTKMPALVSVAGRNYVFGSAVAGSQRYLTRIGKVAVKANRKTTRAKQKIASQRAAKKRQAKV